MFVVIVDITSIALILQDVVFVVDIFELEMHVHVACKENIVLRLLVVVKRIVEKPTVIHKEHFIIVVPEESDVMVVGLEGILVSCIEIFAGFAIVATPFLILGVLEDFLAP